MVLCFSGTNNRSTEIEESVRADNAAARAFVHYYIYREVLISYDSFFKEQKRNDHNKYLLLHHQYIEKDTPANCNPLLQQITMVRSTLKMQKKKKNKLENNTSYVISKYV